MPWIKAEVTILKVSGSVGLMVFQRNEKASSGLARPGRLAANSEPSRREIWPRSSPREPAEASVISLREMRSARSSSWEIRVTGSWKVESV